ncbi:MAG: hypothetical protein DSZ10_02420 [Sulfurovum sp.]|nr:MAG: hypothetical protein DSZ10_02420 [Sulfurovum sp.]
MRYTILTAGMFIIALAVWGTMHPNTPYRDADTIAVHPKIDPEPLVNHTQKVSHQVVKNDTPVNTTSEAKRSQEKDTAKKTRIVELDLDALQSKKLALQGITPQSVWQIDVEKLKKLLPGDTALFTVDGVDYPVKIKEKEKVYGDHVVLTGSYEDEEVAYGSTITIGSDNAQITLLTPEGEYESMIDHGRGYVYRSSAIEEKWVDNTLPDTLTPPKSLLMEI